MNPPKISIIYTVNCGKKGPFCPVTKHLESFCGRKYLQAIRFARDGGRHLVGSIPDL